MKSNRKIEPMKSQISVLLLIVACVGILAGCGQSKAERQRAIKEVQNTKQKSIDASGELGAANQKITSLNSSIGEQGKTIQGLNDSVTAAETSNAEKQAKIDRLMNPEETALADADAAYKAGDKAKALAAYKAFARDFPLSAKVTLAQGKAKEISDAIYREKWIAEAPKNAARQAAAAAAAQAAQDAQNSAAASQDYNNGYAKGLERGKMQAISARSSGNYLTGAQVDFYVNRYANGNQSYADGFRAGFQEAYDKGTRLY